MDSGLAFQLCKKEENPWNGYGICCLSSSDEYSHFTCLIIFTRFTSCGFFAFSPPPAPPHNPHPPFCLFVLRGRGMSKAHKQIISVLCSCLSPKRFCYCSCFHRKMSRHRHVKCLCFLLHHYASTLLPLISSFL